MNPFGGVVDLAYVGSDLMSFLNEVSKRKDADAFRIVNLDFFKRRWQFWQEHLPAVTPYYAIKTNHDHAIVAEIARLGINFDCASVKEVNQLFAEGVARDRIIFANPFKSVRTISFLKEHGIRRLVIDSEDELDKMLQHYADADLVIRISTDDSFSGAPLSAKFGASLESARHHIDRIAKAKASLIGISFHVGSNCAHVPSYQKAILEAASLIAYGRSKHQLPITLLDIGGGFPGANDEAFVKIAAAVNQTLAAVVPGDVEVIAEPGSFFATQSMSVLVRVIGQRHTLHNGEHRQHLYLGTGVYGLFFCGYYKKYDPQAIASYGWDFRALSLENDQTLVPTTLWGPICDSVDKIIEGIFLPRVPSESWLYSHNIGSYTYAVEGDFNQIDRAVPLYVRAG